MNNEYLPALNAGKINEERHPPAPSQKGRKGKKGEKKNYPRREGLG